MARLLWLADIAREAGLSVEEVSGWRDRGSSSFNPKGIVCHHTAGAKTGDMPSLRVLIYGRSDLPGPLCNYGLGRSGKVYVVAAGRANHAGSGSWQGLVGNSSVVGIEAENDGYQAWPDVQLEAYKRLCTAITKMLSGDPKYCCGHKEWAPSRKPDPHSINMADFRKSIANRLAYPTPEDNVARIPNAVDFCVLHNDDLVVVTRDGAIYHIDADGVIDDTGYLGAYNQPEHQHLWGGSTPNAIRDCMGVYPINQANKAVANGAADAVGYCQTFDDGARYHWNKR